MKCECIYSRSPPQRSIAVFFIRRPRLCCSWLVQQNMAIKQEKNKTVSHLFLEKKITFRSTSAGDHRWNWRSEKQSQRRGIAREIKEEVEPKMKIWITYLKRSNGEAVEKNNVNWILLQDSFERVRICCLQNYATKNYSTKKKRKRETRIHKYCFFWLIIQPSRSFWDR